MKTAIKFAFISVLLCSLVIFILELSAVFPFLVILPLILPTELFFFVFFLVFLIQCIRSHRNSYVANWSYGSAFKQGVVYSFIFSLFMVMVFFAYYSYRQDALVFSGQVWGIIPNSGNYKTSSHDLMSLMSYFLFLRFLVTLISGIFVSVLASLFLKRK